jgi:putative protein-disulfide isomerase
MKGKLLYVYDALCGWCYGFGPVMHQIAAKYADQFTVEVISGGMVVGAREGIMDEQMANYILQAIPRLEEYTGVTIGEAYKTKLRSGGLYQSSVKPSIALSVFKSHFPEQSLAFASAIQHAQFAVAKDLQDDQTYLDILQAYPSLDSTVFMQQMQSEEQRYAAEQDFQYAAAMGITGYPALIALVDEKYYLLSKGFQPFESLDKTMQNFVQSLALA